MSVINTNLQTLASARQLNQTQTMLTRSLNRLSSGSKINNASDDPTGLAVSARLDAQSRRAQAASTNVQNAISFVQTTDGFMGNMAQVLSRMSELATAAQDVTKNPSDISQYELEFSALQDQLRSTIGGTTAQIGGTTAIDSPLGSFNGTALFNPSTANLTVTIGQGDGDTVQIGGTDFQQGAMGALIRQDAAGAYNVSITAPGVLDGISQAIDQVATARANIGGLGSRLDVASTQLQVESENLASAISTIRDVDVAGESTQLAKYNILMQSGSAMLAQANQSPQSVLKLIRQ
jgi:flagellin